MCRIEERVYVAADGSRQMFEHMVRCPRARGSHLCANVQRRSTEYMSSPPSLRDDAPSPISLNPPTPPGSYIVEHRRPSTRDDGKSIRSEFVIDLGKEGRDTKYKRSSLGATSSSVSAASSGDAYTKTSSSPIHAFTDVGSSGYQTIPTLPSHRRHPSSASSSRSRPTSQHGRVEDALNRHRTSYPTVVHNPLEARASTPSDLPTGLSPHEGPSRSGSRGADAKSSPYHSTLVSPLSSNSSGSRAAAPEITDRGLDREARRQRAETERKRQEDFDRQKAEALAAEEARQAARETLRFEMRAQERAQNRIAESEKRRAEEREEGRRAKKEQEQHKQRESRDSGSPYKEMEKQARARRSADDEAFTREAERRRQEAEARVRSQHPRPQPLETPTTSRRVSRSYETSSRERDMLLASTQEQMAREREAASRREREERAAMLQRQQQMAGYWDPRREAPPSAFGMPLPTRPRDSVHAPAPEMGMGGVVSPTHLRRVSIHQPAAPAAPSHQLPLRVNTSVNSAYSMRAAPVTGAVGHTPPSLPRTYPSASPYTSPAPPHSGFQASSAHQHHHPHAHTAYAHPHGDFVSPYASPAALPSMPPSASADARRDKGRGKEERKGHSRKRGELVIERAGKSTSERSKKEKSARKGHGSARRGDHGAEDEEPGMWDSDGESRF